MGEDDGGRAQDLVGGEDGWYNDRRRERGESREMEWTVVRVEKGRMLCDYLTGDVERGQGGEIGDGRE